MALAAVVALMFVERRRQPDFDEGETSEAMAKFLTWVSGTRLVLLALAFLFLGCLLISGSRAGLAATIIGVGALFVLMMREQLKTGREIARATLVAIAVASPSLR